MKTTDGLLAFSLVYYLQDSALRGKSADKILSLTYNIAQNMTKGRRKRERQKVALGTSLQIRPSVAHMALLA